MTKKKMNSESLRNLEDTLSELVIEAVRRGIPKSQVGNIFDVMHKTIPSIRRAQEREKNDRRK